MTDTITLTREEAQKVLHAMVLLGAGLMYLPSGVADQVATDAFFILNSKLKE
jgi:hypothetical protein